MSIKILVADKFEKIGLEGLKALGCEVVNLPEAGAANLAGAVKETDPTVLIVRSSKTPKLAIDAGASLQGIIRAGAGYDNIEIPAATAKGVAVCNCPGMNSVAVAELVFGLLLAIDRHIAAGTADLKAGVWNKKTYSKSKGIKGQTLGIIGAGGIGREVIKRAHAFGMKVIAHSLNMTKDRAADLGVDHGGSTRSDLLAMLGRCDAVSVMVAANKESEKMCDAAFFAAMKPGATFINTSRGSVVDENALIDAVKTKGVRVGADVFAGEPAGGEAQWKSALADLPGFVGTHHIGASTDQAQTAVAEEVVRIVGVFKDSGRWENRVN